MRIQKKEKYLRKLFKDLNFDEYYMVSIGTKDEENERSTLHNLLAIDKSLKKVVITIDYDERMEFLCSLGPEHEYAIRYGLKLYNEVMNSKLSQVIIKFLFFYIYFIYIF